MSTSSSNTTDVAALQARIQELEQRLASYQSTTTSPTPLTTPTLDLKPTSTSDDTSETDVVSHDERLRHMLEQMTEIEKQRESLESTYKTAQHNLISRYESESQQLLQSYLDAYTPSAAINTPLLQAAKEMLTEGMYIEINAVALDDYLVCYPTQNHAYRSSTASSSLRSTGYHHFMNQPIHPRVGDLDPLSLAAAAAIAAKGSSTSPSPFPDYVKSIIREREQEQHEKERIVREEIEKQEREHEKKRKAGELLEQRADMALNQVMPLFPYLTIEQCMKALRLNQDNAERTVEWILGKGQDELLILLVEDVTTETKSPEATETITATSTSTSSSSSSSDTMPTQPRLYRQMTAPDKKLLFKVSNITPELTLILQPLMDRNRIPIINSDNELNATYNGYATAVAKLKIPLVHFGKLDYRLVLSEAERACIDADITSRIPTIIYQVHDDACSPLYVDPLVPLHDYDIDFNSSRHTITRVAHRKDGPIQFKAQLEEGLNHNPLMHMKPIELYSQVLDDGTHNIIHMHVNDLKDDLTVDVVNLTGTDKEIKDYHDFPKDVAGRDLSYRIVVRDQKVIAILYPSGGSVKEAKFVEHVLPKIGEFLSLPGDRLARLHHVPIGLIVTNKAGGVDDASKMKTNYKQTGQCSHKHPADLTGFVDVDILFASGSIVDPPTHEAIPYCRIHTATPEQISQYQQKHSTYATDAVTEIETKLEIIEKALANTTASREEQSAMTVAMDNLRTRIVSLQQQPIVKTSTAYTNAGLDARIPKILQAVERRKRAAAFESRSPAMKPATPNLTTSTASMTISSSPSSSPTNKRRADVVDGSNDEKRQKMNR